MLLHWFFSSLFQKDKPARFIFRIEKNKESFNNFEYKRQVEQLLASKSNLSSTAENYANRAEAITSQTNPESKARELLDPQGAKFSSIVNKLSEVDDLFDPNNPRAIEQGYEHLQKLLLNAAVGTVPDNQLLAVLPRLSDLVLNTMQKAAEKHQEQIGEKQKEVTKFLENKDTIQLFINDFDYRQPIREQLKSYLQNQPFWGELSDAKKKKIAVGISGKFESFYERLDQTFKLEVSKRSDQANKIMERAENKYAREDFLEQPIEDLMATEMQSLRELLKNLPTEYHDQLKSKINHKADVVRDRFERKRAEIALTRIKNISLDDEWLKENKYEDLNDFMKLFGQNADKDKRIHFADPVWKIVESSAVEKFKELHREYQEKVDRIPKTAMADAWKKTQEGLNNPEKKYKNFEEFQSDFIQKNFPGQETDVLQYLNNHKNFARTVEASFDRYQKNRTEKIAEQRKSLNVVLSPLRQTAYPHAGLVENAIRKSFDKNDSPEQRDAWLNELNNKYIKKYQQSMDKLAEQRVTAKEKFGKLQNSDKAQALRQTMMKTVQDHTTTWTSFDENFKGPHDLNEALNKQMDQLKSIEKEWDKKIKDVRKQINDMSLKDIKDLDDPQKQSALKNNISAFAKEFDIWTDADVWTEIKDEFGQKMLELHKELNAEEGGEAKNLSDSIKGVKDIEAMDIKDTKKFDLENDDLMDVVNFRKNFDVQMPDDIWKLKGKKAFDIKALELHREFGNKRQEHFKQKINQLSFKENITQQTELVDITNFRQHPDLKVQMTSSEWQQWGKNAFDKRSDQLYKKFRSDREKMYQTQIDGLSLNSLSENSLKDAKNLDITYFRKQFDVLMSDEEWGRFGKSVFDNKVGTLFAEFLEKQKEGDESVMSPEAQAAIKSIDAIQSDDLDTSKLYTDFTAFKRQPFFQENISFDDAIWDQVQDKFQLKSAELFAEHQDKMSPQNRLKDLGQKYNLYRLENVPASSVQDFEMKLGRLEELLQKNPLSIKKFLEYNERERMPFLLDMLGEMHMGDMRELMTDMPESRIMKPDEFTNLMFGNTRRQHVLGEAIRKNSYNWYWFTTKNQDIPLDKEGKTKEIQALTDEQISAPNLDEIPINAIDLDAPELDGEEGSVEEKILTLENQTVENENEETETADDVEINLDEDDENLEDNDELDEGDTESTDDGDALENGDDDSEQIEEGNEDDDLAEEMTEDDLDASDSVDDVQLEDKKSEPEKNMEQPVDETENQEDQKTTQRRSEKIKNLESDAEDLVEHSEDGDENSLPEDWDELIMTEDGQYSAETFGEIYVQQGMRLALILQRVENYVSLIAERNIIVQLDMTDDMKKSYLKKPKIMFRDLVDFALDQEIKTIEKITFTAKMSTKKTLTLRCVIEKKFGLVQKGFRGLVVSD